MANVRKVVFWVFLQSVLLLVAAVKDDPIDRIGFDGTGYVVYPPIDPIVDEFNITRIRFHVAPEQDTGLVLYIGPDRGDPVQPLQNFVALELRDGLPVLVVNYGTWNVFLLETYICDVEIPPEEPFTIELLFRKSYIEMIINDNKCQVVSGPVLPYHANPNDRGLLNGNDPLMLGGIAVDGQFLAKSFDWVYVPQKERFKGCLSNFTVNGRPFDLSMPTVSKHVYLGCRLPKSVATTKVSKSVVYWVIGFAVVLAACELVALFYCTKHAVRRNIAPRVIELHHISSIGACYAASVTASLRAGDVGRGISGDDGADGGEPDGDELPHDDDPPPPYDFAYEMEQRWLRRSMLLDQGAIYGTEVITEL